nr:conopeptide [Conus arenatus]
MPRLEMMLLVLLILPLPDVNVAGGQGDGQGDGMNYYLQRGDRHVYTTCYPRRSGSPWGRCCLTKMCGTMCCEQTYCRCISHNNKGQGCACP